MSQSEYRIGLIGAGGRGRSLGRTLEKVPGARLVAIADLAEAARDRAAADFDGIPIYDDHRTLLERERLDGVIVATLGLHHREPTVDAAAAGVRAIYVEKPMATRLADCDAMIEACLDSGAALLIGHQRRWWPEMNAARDAIRAGAIGQLRHGYLCWPTSRVGSNGTHFFDNLNLVVDDQAEWVSGRLDPTSQPWERWPDILDPGAMGFIVYRNGARVAIDAMDDVRQPHNMYFFGSRGQLYVNVDGAEFYYAARDAEPTNPYGFDGYAAIPGRPFDAPESRRHLDDHGTVEGLTELIDCIATGRAPTSTGAHGRHALEIIVAFHISSRHNMQPVQLPLEGEALDYDARFR